METLVPGGPCDTTATFPDATSTLPPGAVEPIEVMDPIAGNEFPDEVLDGEGPGPARSGGPRGSL